MNNITSYLCVIALSISIANPALSVTREVQIDVEIEKAIESPNLHYWVSNPSIMAKYLLINAKYCFMQDTFDSDAIKNTKDSKTAWDLKSNIKLACDFSSYRYYQFATGQIGKSELLQFDMNDIYKYTDNSNSVYRLYGTIDPR